MQQTTVEGVRIAWARADRDARRQTGRSLIRALAAELCPGADARIERRCSFCGGPHGRPTLPEAPLVTSVAYAADRVIVAVAPAASHAALGIDLELEGAVPDLAALFAPQAPPDLRGWTAIEAVLKADGRGLLVAPDQVVFSPEGDATLPDGGVFRVLPVDAEPAMVVSVAVQAPAYR